MVTVLHCENLVVVNSVSGTADMLCSVFWSVKVGHLTKINMNFVLARLLWPAAWGQTGSSGGTLEIHYFKMSSMCLIARKSTVCLWSNICSPDVNFISGWGAYTNIQIRSEAVQAGAGLQRNMLTRCLHTGPIHRATVMNGASTSSQE